MDLILTYVFSGKIVIPPSFLPYYYFNWFSIIVQSIIRSIILFAYDLKNNEMILAM